MNRRWIILALVFLGIVISYVDRGNLSIAAPSIMKDFAISPRTMGLILSTFFWTYAACQIPAGALVDRLGIRWAYAGAFVIWSLASAGIALSRRSADIVGLRMVLGVAESIGPLASAAFISNNFAGKDLGLPTSVYVAGQNVGPAIGTLVGSILVVRFGWREMFVITGLGGLLWLPFWLWAAPSKGACVVPTAEKKLGEIQESRKWSWNMLLSSGAFWAVSSCILFSSYYWYFVLTWVPSYLIMGRGFTTLEMGHVVSTALFIMAFLNIFAGAVVDRVAARFGVFRTRVLFVAAGYFGTAAILLLLVTDRSWALPILTFTMCATGIGNSNFWAMSQHIPPKSMVGRTIGYLNTISVTGGIAAPLITGFILGPQKHFGPALLIAGVCPVVAAVCVLAAGAKGLENVKAILAGEKPESLTVRA